MSRSARISDRFVETSGITSGSYRTGGGRLLTVVPEQDDRIVVRPTIDLELGRTESRRRRSLRVSGRC